MSGELQTLQNNLYDVGYTQLSSRGFDRINEAFRYTGKLGDVTNELSAALEVGDEVSLMLNAPRLLRGVIDGKLQKPDIPHPEELVSGALRAGLDIYERNPRAAETLAQFRVALENTDMLDAPVEQPADAVSFLFR